MPHRSRLLCRSPCAVPPSALIGAAHILFPWFPAVLPREPAAPQASARQSVPVFRRRLSPPPGRAPSDHPWSQHPGRPPLMPSAPHNSCHHFTGTGLPLLCCFSFFFLFRVWFEFAVSTELVHSRPLNPHEKPFLCFIYLLLGSVVSSDK